MRKLGIFAVFAAASVTACSGDEIIVRNENNPDVERVLARPLDVEASIAASYGRMASSGSCPPSAETMASPPESTMRVTW